MSQIIIRKETESDYKKTEYMTLRAFWNMHGPGCNEHFLVHILRNADCYVPELSRVAVEDGRIVGVIMYSKAKVIDKEKVHEVLTFGPLAVEPTCHNRGIGTKLLQETIPLARDAGYAGIIIFGEPDYYPKHGFKTCGHFGITTADGSNFDAFMAYPLDDEKFSKIHGKFYESEIFEQVENQAAVDALTKQFPYHEPLDLTCQWLHRERLGKICAVRENTYIIKFWEKELQGKLTENFEREHREFPVVGDDVTFEYYPEGDSMITSVCERKVPYRIIRLTDRPEIKEQAAQWFHEKWGIPLEAYQSSMEECLADKTSVPQWYVAMENERIIAGMGVIENDFHDRKDLTPNVCAVYTEKDKRCRGIAGVLLDYVCTDMKQKGIDTLYLITDHTSFYERYGWEFLCMVQGDDEPNLTRMYIHRS